jgi:hypothetical protein
MTDIPIIMSGPMVRACIREVKGPGTGKSETRRLAWQSVMMKKPRRNTVNSQWVRCKKDDPEGEVHKLPSPWQKIMPGDRLWVRESWRSDDFAPKDPSRTIYRADAPADLIKETKGIIKWRPAIHLPRERSRLALVVSVPASVEYLRAITPAAAQREGIVEDDGPEDWGIWYCPGAWEFGVVCHGRTPVEAFHFLWDAIHGKDAWYENPEVVAITFKPHLVNIDQMTAQAA